MGKVLIDIIDFIDITDERLEYARGDWRLEPLVRRAYIAPAVDVLGCEDHRVGRIVAREVSVNEWLKSRHRQTSTGS